VSERRLPDWDAGLLPAIVQDARTGAILTLAWMNRDAFERTLATRETWFWSRSRERLWHKGETSGHFQSVVGVRLDCDADAVLVQVIPAGPACHTGAVSCFFRAASGDSTGIGLPVLSALDDVIAQRAATLPDGSYTTSLLRGGVAAAGAKVREEAEEVVRAVREESDDRVAEEAADLLYHLLVLLRVRGIPFTHPLEVLHRRAAGDRSGEPRPSHPATSTDHA
jgi:phosphoribosyl-ATP pyrophosphohydrolase/phosphoribosyl-AMP cyclohydrolase